ncbi:hypothetical protein ACJA23_03235 [Mycoplasma corogypsi]|uniref:hypothetical protein n=1 Tax=Mycoplasma corogypsi TaxID=2106 RepID=UPI003873338D
MSKKNLKKWFFLSFISSVIAPITLISCTDTLDNKDKNTKTENATDKNIDANSSVTVDPANPEVPSKPMYEEREGDNNNETVITKDNINLSSVATDANATNTVERNNEVKEITSDTSTSSYKDVALQTNLASKLTNKVDSVAYSSQILGYEDRKGISHSYYESPVQEKYKEYGFKFPGYDYNYEGGWDGTTRNFANSFLTVANGQKVNI